MSNIPRKLIINNDCYFHMTWQCHNKSFYFKDDLFKKYYYNLLLKYKKKYKITIYAYCIMSSHFHMVGHTVSQYLLSEFVKTVNSSFAKYYNRMNNKRGQVCMDRFKSPMIETDEDLLRVMKYLDKNPVKAGMVKDPRQYKYCSYRHYAFGEKDPLITDSPAYIDLANTASKRQFLYREMVGIIIKNQELLNKKENYSIVNFIGSPEWVIEKISVIKQFREMMRMKSRICSQ